MAALRRDKEQSSRASRVRHYDMGVIACGDAASFGMKEIGQPKP